MKLVPLAAVAVLTISATAAHAVPNTWAVESAATDAYAELFGPDGSAVRRVSLGTGIDPRGIATVGNVGYVSAALTDGVSSGGVIRSFDLTTGAVLGTVSTNIVLGSLSYDGTGFWAADQGGGRNAYHVTLSGVQDRAPVQLSPLAASPGGLDYFTRNGVSYLIASRGPADASAVYDLYSTTGAVVTSGLLSGVAYGSGIAYDSASSTFVVASSDGTGGGSLLTYGFNGALLSTTALGGTPPDSGFGNVRFLADIALVPTPVPEPVSLGLLAAMLGALGIIRRRAA